MVMKYILCKRHRYDIGGRIYEENDYYTGNIINAWMPIVDKYNFRYAVQFEYGVSLADVCQQLGMVNDGNLYLRAIQVVEKV